MTEADPVWRAFFAELRRLGRIEGQNLVVERRSAGGDTKRIPALVRELLALEPHVIFVPGNAAAEAARLATTTIPIVTIAIDPVGSGFAASIVRPGGNITGFSRDAGGLVTVGKRIELLRQAVPTASRMAFLAPRWLWQGRFGEHYRETAKLLGIAMVEASFDEPVDEAGYRRVFAAMRRDRVDSAIVSALGGNYPHRRLIAGLAVEIRLPTIYFRREFAEAGGLIAYGTDSKDISRGVAGYIDRILKGADPAELPWQQPAKYELVINLKTAKALGLAIPPSLLGIADEVIE